MKTTSDIISNYSGEIVEVNGAVSDDPSLLNSDPFGLGWLAKIRCEGSTSDEALMDQASYDEKYPA